MGQGTAIYLYGHKSVSVWNGELEVIRKDIWLILMGQYRLTCEALLRIQHHHLHIVILGLAGLLAFLFRSLSVFFWAIP